MFTEGAQTSGRRRFLQDDDDSSGGGVHCPRHHEPPGVQPASGRQPGCRGDVQAPGLSAADGAERNGRRSPQRRPVFAGPDSYRRPEHLSQVFPWELNPAQWNYPLEAGPRHWGQCGCVARTRPFDAGMPHPLPHLQVKGQGRGFRRTVRYVRVEEQEGFPAESCHSDPLLNGHRGPRPGVWEAGQGADNHQDRGRTGSEEASHGRAASRNGFFPTEVPQNHLDRVRGLEVRGLEVLEQRTRQDSVRDQIRQVVTDLEGVLGGLKQVHSEMKEVVEQIDRLTASVHLSEEPPCVARVSSSNLHRSAPSGDLRLAPQAADEDRILLRTNSPSPVHMASVVKTRGFTPLGLKDAGHERPSANGHPPHLRGLRDSAHTGLNRLEPRTHTLDPKVVGSGTSNPRTHKPPPYPQNGRCGRGLFPPAKPDRRTPACSGRGRQSSSAV